MKIKAGKRRNQKIVKQVRVQDCEGRKWKLGDK